MPRPSFWLSGLLVLSLSAAAAATGKTLPAPGVVVEEVGKRSSAEWAEIQTGDVIESWSRAPADAPRQSGAVSSPFDLAWLGLEQAPRGGLMLHGRRGTQSLTWSISTGDWKLKTRPALPAKLQALHATAGELLQD